MRIPRSPTIRIATDLLLAALLSIAGYQVFRRRSSQAPEALLKRADHMAWLNNWIGAAPKFSSNRGISAQKLYARVGEMSAHNESLTTIPRQTAVLNHDLSLPAARDEETRLRILTILGMLR